MHSVLSTPFMLLKKVSQCLAIVMSFFLLSACLPEEEKEEDTNPINSSGVEVDDASLGLNGFWVGGFNQTETLKLLIYNGDVFGIDADKAFFGTVDSTAESSFQFTLLGYSLSYLDTVNEEYASDGGAISYTIDGRLFNFAELEIAASFDTNDAPFGEFNVINDKSYSSNSSLSSLVGMWTTAKYQLRIDREGGFIMLDTSDSGCVSNGRISLLDNTNSLMALNISRDKCEEFNGNASGYAAINLDGELEFYSKLGNSLLFMTFAAPTSTGGTTTTETSEEEVAVE